MPEFPVVPLGGQFYWCPALATMVRGETREVAQLRATLMGLKAHYEKLS